MHYCISDIHGCYDQYEEMLEKLNLNDDRDILYILGDIVDRGSDPLKLLMDMMERPNVIPLVGNHEYMMLQNLMRFGVEITDESIKKLTPDDIRGLQLWLNDGGRTTLAAYMKLDEFDREDVLDYIGGFSLFEEEELDSGHFVMVHAGLNPFVPDKPLEDYTPAEMLFARTDYDIPCFEDRFLVTGHNPLHDLNDGRILRKNNHIAIDCGCVYGGPLGAICLETGKEFYI